MIATEAKNPIETTENGTTPDMVEGIRNPLLYPSELRLQQAFTNDSDFGGSAFGSILASNATNLVRVLDHLPPQCNREYWRQYRPAEFDHITLDVREDPFGWLSMDVPKSHACVYFLIKKKRIVYVGKSTNILSRIGNWQAERGIVIEKFDSVRYVFVDPAELDLIEAELICRLRPKLNRDIPEKRLKTFHALRVRSSRGNRVGSLIAGGKAQ